MIKKGLTLSLLFTCMMGHSQESIQSQHPHYGYIQLLYHTGVYWSRTQFLKEKFADGYKAVEVRIGFQTTGNKWWQQLNNYPGYGIGFHYADLIADRKDVLVGNPLSAFVFYSAPRARIGRLSLHTDLSLGLSYASVIHDPVTNPLNDVIASHVNLYFDFNVNVNYMLSDRLDLKAGYGVTHYSNGRIHEPQKGVNNWGWNMGLNYHFVQNKTNPANQKPVGSPNEKIPIRPEFIQSTAPGYTPFQELQFMYGAGVVDNQRLGDLVGTHYLTSSLTVDYALAFHPRMAITFGVDALYDGSLVIGFMGVPPQEVSILHKTHFGSHLGYQFFIDRVTLIANFGTYFFHYSNDRGYWFIRTGGRVRLTEHLHAHICIKTKNGISSDWIEWGLACALKIR